MKKSKLANINLNTLLRFCQVRDFSKLAREYNATEVTGWKLYDTWFVDRGKRAKVLAVAHFDTVYRGKGPAPVKLVRKDGRVVGINSIQLDDRLGAYIILDMLPRMGIDVDVLITTDEEVGMSTAQYFKTKKEYNWIFSFDRRGVQPVMYEYEDNLDWVEAINAVTKTTWGSFSDICDLDTLGVCGVNWGTAYNNEHSNNCYANLNDILYVVNTFASFYWDNWSIKYPFDAATSTYYARKNSWSKWDSGYSAGSRTWVRDDKGNWVESKDKGVWDDDDLGYSTRGGTYYNSLQDRIDSFNRDEWDDWKPDGKTLTGKGLHDAQHRTGPKGDEYLCEYCWTWHKRVIWSDAWAAWLDEDCLHDLNNMALANCGG